MGSSRSQGGGDRKGVLLWKGTAGPAQTESSGQWLSSKGQPVNSLRLVTPVVCCSSALPLWPRAATGNPYKGSHTAVFP